MQRMNREEFYAELLAHDEAKVALLTNPWVDYAASWRPGSGGQ